jgi:peptidoglycan/xylan/chitin deacetylase (PgdA/CDA1 family)
MAAEIKINKYELEVITGKPVLSFCYPRGRFDENVKKAVQDAGYVEARTTRIMQTFESSDPYEKDTTIHMNPRDEYQGKHWLEVAKDMLTMNDGTGVINYFHVWGHSWEIDKNHEWHNFETLLEILSKYK